MKFTLLLLLTFIIGSHACLTKPCHFYGNNHVGHSKNCEACTECNYSNDDTKRSNDMWCKNPVCGEYDKPDGITCPITYYGLCGLTKCAKRGVTKSMYRICPWSFDNFLQKVKSEGMCKIEESKLDKTKSIDCCRDECPWDKNGNVNRTFCTNSFCGQDGKFYSGMCALSKCGKTVS